MPFLALAEYRRSVSGTPGSFVLRCLLFCYRELNTYHDRASLPLGRSLRRQHSSASILSRILKKLCRLLLDGHDMTMKPGSVLVYLIRRDMRVADNPILYHLTTSTDHGYTHLLPIYVFDPLQIEVSGFLKDGEASPYPEARSAVGHYWRTGPHRAKFIAQSVWDLKQSLEHLNSDLLIQFGPPEEVVKRVIEAMKDGSQPVGGVYMTEEKSSEEVDGQESVKQVCKDHGVKFKLWHDEKYFIDE